MKFLSCSSCCLVFFCGCSMEHPYTRGATMPSTPPPARTCMIFFVFYFLVTGKLCNFVLIFME